MKRRALTPSVYTYSALINAAVRCGDAQQAQQLMCDMQADGVKPNEVLTSAFRLSSINIFVSRSPSLLLWKVFVLLTDFTTHLRCCPKWLSRTAVHFWRCYAVLFAWLMVSSQNPCHLCLKHRPFFCCWSCWLQICQNGRGWIWTWWDRLRLFNKILLLLTSDREGLGSSSQTQWNVSLFFLEGSSFFKFKIPVSHPSLLKPPFFPF